MAAGDIFTSGIALSFLGYKLIFLEISAIFFKSDDTLDVVVKKNPGILSINDPRGVFTAGMVPSKQFSYRVVINSSSGFVGQPVSGSILGVGFDLDAGFKTAQSKNRTSVVAFEGIDVIDLPAKDLPRSGNTITLPDTVYKCYYAGADKLIKSGDNITQKTAVALKVKTIDNKFVKIVPTENRPEDSKVATLVTSSGGLLDTASNKIEVDGDVNFVSYTAIKKHLFRDVIITSASSFGFGFGNLITSVAAAGSYFWILRFAYIPVKKRSTNTDGEESSGDSEGLDSEESSGDASSSGDENSKQVSNWKLSESFIIPPPGGIEPPTTEALKSLSSDEKKLIPIDFGSNHAVYNLNDEGPDTDTGFNTSPLLKGVSPALARAKMDPSSKLFDEKFDAKIINAIPGFASGGGILIHHTAGIGTNLFTAQNTLSYTSSVLDLQMSKSARFGIEYVNNLSGGAGGFAADIVVFARTQPKISGLAVVYDCCINVASVIDVVQSGDKNSLVERVFDDTLWAKVQKTTPKNETGGFMTGEFPHRSDGKIILTPKQEEIEDAIEGDKITIPSNTVLTAILAKGTGSSTDTQQAEQNTETSADQQSDTLAFFDSSDDSGDILFETALVGGASSTNGDRTVFLGLPPLNTVQSFRSGGGITVDKLFGNTFEQPYLPDLSSDSSSKDPSDIQIAQIEEETFPMSGSNQSADGSCSQGWSYMAFENEDRVDLAIRRFYSQNWIPIRDMTLRISDDFDNKSDDNSEKELPPSSLPFVVSDPETNITFIFYVYKNHLLVKKIPGELLMSEKIAKGSSSFSADAEKNIIKKLHKLGATVVYDSGGGGEGETIEIDVQLGAIKGEPKEDKKSDSTDTDTPTESDNSESNTESSSTVVKETKPISQYSACIDTSGYLYAFIQTEDLKVFRRSPNLGDTWVDILPRDFTFIPKPEKKEGESSEDISEESFSCMFDIETKNMMFFFFLERNLYFVRVPSELLRRPPAVVQESMSKIRPTLLLGTITKDLIDRGVKVGPSVSNNKEEPPEISPHRVAGYITNDGYYRVFFKEDTGNLSSLISFNTGDTWLTERQFEDKGALRDAENDAESSSTGQAVTTGAGQVIANAIQGIPAQGNVAQ